MNPEKLAKLQAAAAASRIGGKGTPRRKVKKVHKNPVADDKKIQATLKKLNVQPLNHIEEVNFFKNDGSIMNFRWPKVLASPAANTFVVEGTHQIKQIHELLPDIISQLGPESIESLRKLAETLQLGQAAKAGEAAAEGDDDVPELVENL
ncbi:NAC domain-containing protein [Polychytrium aggregatum]|uniref:NAC domain-containing protein n=1 Tax=Polychytrium aggregatum TaxID=110093 RepID=UPI0022FE473E|nr:NAC domain-containing protein [Polychytrium aggregatum]KAI9206851.1 NAC domain-containing protein [Polychytrium aggregatum]